jgi:hypothetical protein
MQGQSSVTIMTIDNIIEKFDQPNDFQDQKSTKKKEKSVCIANTKKLASTFFGSRWMGLVIGPAYGLFLYLYVTHLILGGPPFTTKGRTNETEAVNNSVQIKDLKESLSVEDEPDFEPLMSRETSHFIGLWVGGGTGIALTAYSVFSTEVRCSMVLMVPSLLTKRGRGFMLTFVTSLLIEGPVDTIKHNLQEVVRSFTCMYEHIKSLSERFKDQFLSLMKQVKAMFQEVEDMVSQYKIAIEKMVRNATEDQRQQIEQAKADLERQSKKIKDSASKISDVLNAPGKFFSGVCVGSSKLAEGARNFFKGVGSFFGGRRKRGACKIPDVVDIPGVNVPDIGIEKLKNILKTLKPDLDFIDFDYDSLLGQIESSSISEIRNQLKAIFKQALKFGKVIATWWSKIFYLTIIFVVLDAIKYQRKHFADDGFDNMLIDDNLKKASRRDGQRKLTPIRKWEAKERYQVATSIKLSKKEIKKIVLESIPSIIMTIIIVGVVLTDLVFAKVLQTFQEHAKFGISFPGMEQGISFSSMIKDTDAKLNILKIEAFDLRTDPCLPKAKMTPPSILVPIILILLFCAISCIVNAYATRLRAIICNFFHPGRADERANFLYK